MRKKTLALFLTCVLAAGMLAGCGNKDSKDNNQVENSQGTESAKDDQAAADEVAELIDAIYVQERTDKTDEQCAAAKEAWDKLTDAQKALVSGENADPDYFGRDTGDASKDDPLNQDNIGDNEILVVSFGTSFNDSRAADISGVEKAIQAANPDWAVRRAFTAQIIINHVQARDGEKIDNVDQALQRAVDNGVKNLVIQPTHLMHGAEYDELVGELDAYKDKFEKVVVAEPLLGEVGDDAVSDYSAFDYLPGYNYNSGGAVIDGNWVVGTSTRGLPNQTLSWMTAKILDIGVDLGFLNNRLNIQFDYFRRVRDGIPEPRYDVLIPNEAGFSLPKENLKSDMHRGFDASIMWTDQINDFNYSVGGNITYSRFWDWEQYKPRFSNSWDEYRNSIWHRVGYVNWGYEAIGRFDSWEQIANYPVDNDRKGNRTVVPGDIMYKDQNNDGVINYLDERPIGYRVDSTPTLNFGINLSASWKGFDLAMDWTGSGMTSWNQCYETARPFQNDGNSPDEVLKDAWHLSDIWDANSPLIPGKYPMVRLNTDETSAYDKSSYWLHNVTYLKLRNLEVGYTFPKTWLNRTGISNLRLFVSGTNLLTLSNLSVMDPECASDNGLDYPPMRVINIGVNLKF